MKTHRQTLNYLSSYYLIVSKLNLQHYFVKTKILYNWKSTIDEIKKNYRHKKFLFGKKQTHLH